ncbi:hypothetical protein EIP91_006036 [Steccherinum ochraceum]|uniref:Tyr recombinase domain-containing protein n=1 Tax=Steccherinum ochraceum TaxID=92696 RepID=A0A4R0R6B6_9APHY|nr:hypothetical protein EIP91_006036 [Steccherinum ochraceum]
MPDAAFLTANGRESFVATSDEMENEEIALNLEEAKGFEANLDSLLDECIQHFPADSNDPLDMQVAEYIRGAIKKDTRDRHVRVAKNFCIFNYKRNPQWDPKLVSEDTPRDITRYITHRCGDKRDGYEGLGYSTAIAIRAALTMWYGALRPNERVDEWRQDQRDPKIWHGLPTRSREVSRFMVGLEKAHVGAGKSPQSMRGTTMDDMHRLCDSAFRPGQDRTEQRRAIVRYCAYGLAFLMMLRVNEVLKIRFENMQIIPGVRDRVLIILGPRKTSQTELHSYTLFANDDDPRLCPMRMLIMLWSIYSRDGFKPTGLLIRSLNSTGCAENAGMTTAALHRGLMSDLQALGYTTWAMYGTHSFRRGGCQYRIKVKRWTVDMVAVWGDWTQVEAVTMFRYFYSPNDNHEFAAEYDRNYPKRVFLPFRYL